MGCFAVSGVAAIGVAAAKYVVKHNEKKNEKDTKEVAEYKFGSDVKWCKKFSYLELALWSGSFVLAGEHVIHGEVAPFPPFFTAAQEGPDALKEMFTEMATVGVCMMVSIILVWAIGVFLYDLVKFRQHKKAKEVNLEVK